MQEKIQVLGVEIDNCSAKEAMKRVIEHVQMERLNVVEMVSMNTLAQFQQTEDDKHIFEAFDLCYPSDPGILRAAGIEEEQHLRDVEELLFIKMVMRYLQRNHIRVFMISENKAARTQLEEYMEAEYGGLKVVQSISLEECGDSEEMLLNYINGAEVECVLSTLSSPREEYFISKNKALVNARVWLGFGLLIKEVKQEKSGWKKWKGMILSRILKKEVQREQKKKSIGNIDNSEK